MIKLPLVFGSNGEIQQLQSGDSLSGVSYWVSVPGSPSRVGNTSFTITDTGNASLYNKLLTRLTVLKWTDSGSTKMAMVTNATYASNTVTITIIGDTLTATATMSSLMYTFEKARFVTFTIAGTIAAFTNLSRVWQASGNLKIFGARATHGTAGTTNSTTYDINIGSTPSTTSTAFTTKVSVSSGSTDSGFFTSDSGTTMTDGQYMNMDCDTVSTTQPIDLFMDIFYTFLDNQYL